MKWKRVSIIILSVAVVFGLGSTYAAFRGASNPINQEVSATNIGVGAKQFVPEPGEGDSWSHIDGVFMGMVPGSTVDMTIAAENTGDTDGYMRIRLNGSWQKDGEKYFDVESGVEYTLNDSDWFVIEEVNADGTKGEDVYGYYKSPVSVGDSTSDFLTSFSVLSDPTENSNAYANLSFIMDYEVETVQTLAADEAMLAQWGMEATFDGSGNITRIAEQQ